MTAPTQTQDVDGADEADHDAQEVAIGAAIAALLLLWLLPGPPSLLGNIARVRRSQLEAAIGQTVRGFVSRSASDLAAASGRPGASAAAANIVPSVYRDTMTLAGRWVEDSYQRLQGRLGPTIDPASPVSDGGGAGSGTDEESDVRKLIDQAGHNDGRALAAYAKNEARDRTAGEVGALWSIWASRHDSRVRESHRDLDGQKVPHGGKFVLGGDRYIRFPGDPLAPASETMGCRCRLRYRFRPVSLGVGDV